MQLFPTPDNPIPGNATLMSVTTSDGIVLRVAHWKATTREVRGTVCILQGRAEFIEKYFEVVRDLRGRGFAVAAFDWRGQGHSGRQVGSPRKGHVRHFDEYRKDLEAIRDHVLIPHLPEPYFARSATRVWVEQDRPREPDVSLLDPSLRPVRPGTVDLVAAMTAAGMIAVEDPDYHPEPFEEPFLEVRSTADDRLVTAIEVLSLANKSPGDKGRASPTAAGRNRPFRHREDHRPDCACAGQRRRCRAGGDAPVRPPDPGRAACTLSTSRRSGRLAAGPL